MDVSFLKNGNSQSNELMEENREANHMFKTNEYHVYYEVIPFDIMRGYTLPQYSNATRFR